MQQDIARPQRLQQCRRCGAPADAQARVDAQCSQPGWLLRGRRKSADCGLQRGQQRRARRQRNGIEIAQCHADAVAVVWLCIALEGDHLGSAQAERRKCAQAISQ